MRKTSIRATPKLSLFHSIQFTSHLLCSAQRDSQIDELERVSFIEKIRSAPETTPEEKKMLMCSLVFAENIGE